jgi:hypothetical protein
MRKNHFASYINSVVEMIVNNRLYSMINATKFVNILTKEWLMILYEIKDDWREFYGNLWPISDKFSVY